MLRTEVGYAGGKSASPDYRHIGDHSETVRIEFDPRRISYRKLLDLFWQSHDPTSPNSLRQYRNAIFTTSAAQRQQALASKQQLASRLDRELTTAIEPLAHFTPAEAYHQKHSLRQAETLYSHLQKIYPRQSDLIASTAAARLNGYLGCSGDPDQFETEVKLLGLTPELEQQLRDYLASACRNHPGSGCALQ